MTQTSEVARSVGNSWFTARVDPTDLLAVLEQAADAVVAAFAGHDDWGPSGGRADQYLSDVVADAAARTPLAAAGLRVLSEESGLDPGDGPVVVIDPLDGSTNASRRLPWYATSMAVVDHGRPIVALVHDHGSGRRHTAVAGAGAWLDGEPLPPRGDVALAAAIVAVNGVPPAGTGWAQFRCLGASALDLCAVADGRLDGYVDFDGGLGVWDYLGAMLVCAEVGVDVVDGAGRELVVLDHGARRSPVAGPPGLLDELRAIRGVVVP